MIPRHPYGKTGAIVSRLGLGAMRLPVVGADNSVTFEESTRIIRRALQLGVNFFDSHLNYLDGQSEPALGAALAGVARSSYVIQTKNPDYREETQGDTYRDRLLLALEHLGCGHIDFYLMHSLTWERFAKTGKRFLKVADEAKREGLIRHVGFSCHDTVPNMLRLIETGAFECMLVQYNYIDSGNAEALAAAHERGMGTSAMGPLGGGRFVAPSSFLTGAPRDESAVKSAFRFVLSNENLDCAMSGMMSVREVEENARIASKASPLSGEERRRIERDAHDRRKLAELYCTGCGYCAPCPHEVSISEVFNLRNHHEVFGLHEYARGHYAKLLAQGHAAPSCQECGACEEKCPQHISIREELVRCHRLLSDEPFKRKPK
ncbi:MAG: aldo/keto reductase [Planctomycetota bacterium]